MTKFATDACVLGARPLEKRQPVRSTDKAPGMTGVHEELQPLNKLAANTWRDRCRWNVPTAEPIRTLKVTDVVTLPH